MDQEFLKLDWQNLKQLARKVGVSWAEAMLQDFQEPVRSGTRKGDLIGIFRKKRKASLLMILHPYGLKLNEIAGLVGTTGGTVRFWRCQEDFQKAEDEAYTEFGQHLKNTFERVIEGESASTVRPYLTIQGIPPLEKRPVDLVRLIPFFNSHIVFFIEELIRSKFYSGKREYTVLAVGFLEMVYSHLGTVADSQKVKAFRTWMRDPNVHSFAKIAITELIDILADPDCWEKYSEDAIKIFAETLKSNVFNFLRLL